MTSSHEQMNTAGTIEAAPAPRRRRRLRVLLPVLAVALLAVGCSSGPGSQDDLQQVLVDNGGFTESEAECIADDVFAEYGADEEALSRISSAPNFELLNDAEEGVPGFAAFFDETVASCAAVGPTTG